MRKENSALKDEILIEHREFSLLNKSISLKMESIQLESQEYAKRLEQETQKNVISYKRIIIYCCFEQLFILYKIRIF